MPRPGWYPRPDGAAGLRWWDGATWTSFEAPLPTPGWYPDLDQPSLLRWWDGDWTSRTRPHPDVPRDIWSRWFIILIVCWLVTLGTSLGLAVALASVHTGDQSWWVPSIPLLVELGLTLAVGAALGWRRRWDESLILGLSSVVVVVGAFMFGVATSSEPGADDAAGAGLVVIGVPLVTGIIAIVLLGAVIGAGGRRLRQTTGGLRNGASPAQH